jgi:hypothetical protein
MLDRMRAKPGGADIPVTLGDFTEVAVDGEYAVVYIVFSTLYGLLTQEAQVACVRHAAARLAPGGFGRSFVPDPTRRTRPAFRSTTSRHASTCRSRATIRSLSAASQHVAGAQGAAYPSRFGLRGPAFRFDGAAYRAAFARARGDWRPATGSGGHISISSRALTAQLAGCGCAALG